jgi:putative autoinducer-2 (AI-2) aldolase
MLMLSDFELPTWPIAASFVKAIASGVEALTMAYNAIQQGAAGVDMGRNVFQSDAPKAMVAAVHAVVHRNLKPTEAFELFRSLKANG